MHFSLVRLAGIAAAVALVVSCDAPAVTRFGSGISGGPTGTAPIVPPAPGSVDSNAPFVRIDTPIAPPVGQTGLVSVGDSILVAVRITDDRALRSVTITGWKEVGSRLLGTFQRIQRYPTQIAPVAGEVFRPGLTDTVILRYLKPTLPLDTALGPLVIEAIVLDAANNADTATRVVNIVTGPKLVITAPDSVPRGISMQVSVRITHNDGVARDTIRVIGASDWTTPLDTTIVRLFPTGSRDVTHEVSIAIPADARLGSRLTINASARDVNGNPGIATPRTVVVRDLGSSAPSVTQIVPARMEMTDSITVSASGDGIRFIGRILLDSLGNQIRRDSVEYTAPFTSNRTQKLPLLDSLPLQGQRITVISFAGDNSTPARVGFSIPAGTSAAITSQQFAHTDTARVTFGRTFSPPRVGVMGDLAVDANLGNVFLSNTANNLLEVWDNTGKTFAANGIPVGAQPWGLFQSNDPDTLFVGNSGATTISRVFIGTNDKTQMREALARRIRTRDIIIHIVQFVRDASTGKIRLVRRPNVSYSDRPQYVVESQGGRIFFSTKPTSAAQPGTLRWIDPALPFPDPQQIISYGTADAGDVFIYSIFHADSIRIGATPANSPASDTLYVWDHPYGQLGPTIEGVDSIPVTAINDVRALGSDAFAVLNMDMESLELSDTTFVAASGDRTWIGFGEGNTPGTGRIMMVNDPAPLAAPGFFSPAIAVTDLVHNASERVFGLAIDSTGLQVTSHGLQTYMAALDQPFHLRLDGVYDSFDNGAGVAYHPRAKSTLSQPEFRVSFSATASGIIEVIDVAHYNNRGRFVTKGNLYGPLRATGALPGDNVGLTCPGDARCVVLKLFGLTANGLIVIDVRAADIKPAP